MRISDWSSDVCSSDLLQRELPKWAGRLNGICVSKCNGFEKLRFCRGAQVRRWMMRAFLFPGQGSQSVGMGKARSEEHTSELQSLMRISYAVFCLKKKKT